MQENFSELIEYLDKKFGGVETRLDGVENRIGGVENLVIKLNNRLTSVEEKLEHVADKKDIQHLYDAVDSYAKKADMYFQVFA